ncbi:phosphogluconate dehydratase, partial [Azospirillum brasilense]|uniref:dihydroxy-acid dehydratase domain-containing protein n=1 Tax=Azospirillum brasilense TaxID=192 RepID=UPI00190A66EA
AGGPLGRVRDGDVLRLDAERGTLEVLVDDAEWDARPPADAPADAGVGCGRELFGVFRRGVGSAEGGASVFG